MAASKIVWGFMCAATLAACGGETAAPAAGDQTAEAAAPEATVVATTPPAAAPTGTGPIDGIWRCKMNGDIPLGTLTFAGGQYTFETTNTAWEPNPNPSDGSGTVTFNETYVLPQDGPLKTEFAVTGAFGDGSFINFNTDLGMMFGCRRP
jgi:hypothetical protein